MKVWQDCTNHKFIISLFAYININHDHIRKIQGFIYIQFFFRFFLFDSIRLVKFLVGLIIKDIIIT